MSMKLNLKFAFTLNEVLITLGILGIVAAFTMPTLTYNIQSRLWNKASESFERELVETMKIMNLKKALMGYTTTASFVNRLQDYIKITKVCKTDNLASCFSETVYWGAGDATPEEVKLESITKAAHLGQAEWDSEVIGLQFPNGTTGLIAYNPKCTSNHLNNEEYGRDCIALLYDTTGLKAPNTGGKDIRSLNVLSLGKESCYIELEGRCFSKPFVPIPHVWNECNNFESTDPEDLAFMAKYNINYCMVGRGGPPTDYWAGAVKKCGGKSKLVSTSDALRIARYVYNTDKITSTGRYSGYSLDKDKAAQMGLTRAGSSVLWTNYEYGQRMTAFYTFVDDYVYGLSAGNFTYDFAIGICVLD